MAKKTAVAEAATGTTAIPLAKSAALDLLIDRFGLDPATMSPTDRRSAISGYDLKHRIEAMVAGITGKRLKYVYQGDGAATAPGLMILPRIPATSLFPLRHVRILLGYGAHEICHQLYTVFPLLTELFADPGRDDRQKQQIKEFWNAIEDYRIEKVNRRDHPGFHPLIDDTRDFSARRFCDRVDAGVVPDDLLSNPYRIGSVALTWIGAELNGYATRAPSDALARLTPEVRDWAESWRAEIAAVMTCAEAKDLAERIVDDLDASLDQTEQGKNGSDGQQGGKPQQGGKSQQGGKPGDGSQSGGGGSGGSGGPNHGEDEKTAPNSEGEKNDKKDRAGDHDAADDAPDAKGDGASKNGDTKADDATAKSAGDDATDPGSDGSGQGDGKADAEDAPEENGGASRSSAGDSDKDADGVAGDAAAGGGTGSAAKNGTGSDDGTQPGGGGCGSSRPRAPVKRGDERHAAEAADLEIEEIARIINALGGATAEMPAVADEKEMAILGADDGDPATQRETVERGQSAYAKIRREVGAPASRAAGILRRLLQSTAKRTWQGGREEGDLDFGRLVGMTRGDQDVYRQRVERQSVNTAVHLLLDNSGSMMGHPLRVCQETAVVLDMAVQGTRTNVEITGFTGCVRNPVLYRYRAFGQKGQAASASLGNMTDVALGGTPVSTPLLEAWRRLSMQKEPRRLLIVVSDGGADYNDVANARAAHDFIVSQGCSVLGIAIGRDQSMRNWCSNVQAVANVDDLPVALTNLMRDAIR